MSMFAKFYQTTKSVEKYESVEEKQNKRYIFVPYEYKEQAKKLNAKFDRKSKKWYVTPGKVDYQRAVDIFHIVNFRHDETGYCLKCKITKESERK